MKNQECLINELTPEQKTALCDFAMKTGYQWKKSLVELWDGSSSYVKELKEIKIKLGTNWLNKVTTKDLYETPEMVTQEEEKASFFREMTRKKNEHHRVRQQLDFIESMISNVRNGLDESCFSKEFLDAVADLDIHLNKLGNTFMWKERNILDTGKEKIEEKMGNYF